MIFEHANTSLLKAIALAGSQRKLADVLNITPPQLSSWLHNPDVNMPYKYGKMIEKWSAGQINIANLFPKLVNIETASQDRITALSLELLIKQAKEAGVGILVSVSLDTDHTIKDTTSTH